MNRVIDFVSNSVNKLEDSMNWLFGRNWAVIRFSNLLDQKLSKLQRFRHLDDALAWIDENICTGENKEKEVKMLCDAIANKDKIDKVGYYETKVFAIVHKKWLRPNKNTSSFSEIFEDFKRWITGDLWVIIHFDKIKRVHTLDDAIGWINNNLCTGDDFAQMIWDMRDAIKKVDEIEQRRYYESRSFTIIKLSLLRELK